MKKRLSKVIFVLIFLSGLSLLLYPYVANMWNAYRQSKLITTYEQVVGGKLQKEDYSDEWEKANKYNKTLFEENDYGNFCKRNGE